MNQVSAESVPESVWPARASAGSPGQTWMGRDHL